MTLIQLLLTGACAAVGLGALLAGNCLEALLIWLLPIGYYAIRRALKMREQRKAEQAERKKRDEEYVFDRWEAQKKVDREMRSEIDGEVYNRHRAAQLQQMNMMHQNASQAAAAQQQASMNARQGWTDPRASYGSDLADNIINLWAINSMMNQPSGVHASTISPSGPPVNDAPTSSRVDAPPVSSYFSDSSSSSSSSSSYSSDTSSDSFGGSDTSLDSF